MAKFSLSVFLFIYFFPILFVYMDQREFEFLQLQVILFSYITGAIFAYIYVKDLKPVDNGRFYIDSRILYILFALYVIAKYSTILSALGATINGNFTSFAMERTIDRYENFSEVSKQTFLERLGTISFLSFGSFLGAVRNTRKKHILMFILMIFVESVSLARLGVLLSFVGFVIEKIIRKSREIEKLNLMRLIRLYSVIAIILLIIFSFSAYFRVSSKDNAIEIVVYKLGVYTVAMYEALMHWMYSQYDYNIDLGYNSFASIYKIFGIEFEQGFYDLTATTFGPTNIYTSIRGYLSDFGLLGTSFLFLAFGFFPILYSRVRLNYYKYIFLRFILWNFVFVLISPFNYFNFLAGFIIFSLFVAISTLKKSRN